MYPRGHRGFGALLMLVLLLAGGLAVLPWNASAQGNQLVGLVYQCGSPATFVDGATVTLSDAHGVQSSESVTTLGDGTFTFEPSPGYYNLEITKDEYFANGTADPVRFDDTSTVSLVFCLDPTPTSDKDVDLLVVSAARTHRGPETINFPKTGVSNENAAPTWTTPGNTVTLQMPPVSSQGLTVRYTNTGLGGSYSNAIFVQGVDYQVTDYWTGRIQVLNAQAINDLNTDKNKVFFSVSYSSWTPSVRLAYYPIEYGYIARKNAVSWNAAENTSWEVDIDTGILTILGNLINGTDTLTFEYDSVVALSGATVDAYYPAKGVSIRDATTDSAGAASLVLWADSFQFRTTRAGYAPNVLDVTVTASTSLRIRMEAGLVLTGHARDAQGRYISAGLKGTLYNLNPGSDGQKVIEASVVGSLYSFNAPAGTYRMVIDANGYAANASTVVLSAGPQLLSVVLGLSDPETYRAEVVYGRSDWGNLTIYRNLTLNSDSSFPDLEPANLRDLRLQIDYTLGNGDGSVSGAEGTAFRDWLLANGPRYVTTDGFLQTNSKAYRSALAYGVTVEGLASAGKVWINATTNYALSQTPPYISFGATKYFVNVTATPDSNVSVYQDRVYVIDLPRTYEAVSSSVINGPVETDGFTRVTLDPGQRVGASTIRMTIERSENGTARAKVTGPVGNFHVVNASFAGYVAYVANNTNLTFSAEDSTDPVGDITTANFTWKFASNTTEAGLPENIGYGLTSYHTYKRAGEYVVNLTVVEAGGNVTYRDITLFVDDQAPVARIKTNRTGSGNVNGTTLLVNEDVIVRFDASLSTDLAYTGKNGVIPDGGYAWDFDGDRITDATGRLVNWSFQTPGEFKVNLTVTDGVGWKSVNATITARVNDTTAPTPAIDIRDPNNEWALADTLTEGRPYSLNATRTTDNHDQASALNYTWSVPGPIEGRTGKDHTFWGMNISFTWREFNSSGYKVVLTVNDTGFGSQKPNSGRLERTVIVQIDAAARPDLRVESGTMKASRYDPEEGEQVEFRVNITNKANRGTASNVTAKLYTTFGGQTTILSESPKWEDENGTEITDRVIAPGETVTLVFVATMTGAGNKTIEVLVRDSEEAYTQISAENRGSIQLTVRQAAWVNLAVYGSIIGVIALAVVLMWYRRKVRAGELQPIRFRREKKAEGGAKARKEPKEEKKRL